MSYLDRLHTLKAEKAYVEELTKLTEPGFDGFVSYPHGAFSEKTGSEEQPLDPSATLREWHAGLSPLDPLQPTAGFEPHRWALLVDDAWWIYENFASRAVRDGWSAADLFGLWPDKPGWGGIADRLRGARSLVMGADCARWRRVLTGSPERFNRGSYPDLPLVWEG